MADLKAIAENVIAGKADKVKELTQAAIDSGVNVKDVLEKGLIAGMAVVGAKFKANEFYVPEVLIAARAMKAGMVIVEPLLEKAGIKPTGKIAIGTVKGDLHDIGKNLVAMMMKGAGFHILDLGIDVSPEKFTSAVAQDGAQIVCLSALLTTTMTSMKTTIQALQAGNVRNKVKVMIGGAPVTQSYADEIGADGYAPDAASAVDKAKVLLGI